MSAEAAHVAGEKGVYEAKRHLDSSTHINITFTVYDDPAQTTLTGLGNTRKVFDMTGMFLGDARRPRFVEVKNYNSVGDQGEEYTKFLAMAYSVTAAAVANKLDRKIEFMWATWHPFSQNKWSRLTTEGEIRAALDKHPEYLAGSAVDHDVVRLLTGRLWLVPLHRRQGELVMSREELLAVHKVLGRKGIV